MATKGVINPPGGGIRQLFKNHCELTKLLGKALIEADEGTARDLISHIELGMFNMRDAYDFYDKNTPNPMRNVKAENDARELAARKFSVDPEYTEIECCLGDVDLGWRIRIDDNVVDYVNRKVDERGNITLGFRTWPGSIEGKKDDLVTCEFIETRKVGDNE